MNNSMKAYLIITGLLFALLASAHLVITIKGWSRLTTEPGFLVEGPGIGLLAAALSFWAWRLLWVSVRPKGT
jgi:CDP-diglyceride synthetase